jgi:hypothetical protein
VITGVNVMTEQVDTIETDPSNYKPVVTTYEDVHRS